MYVDDIEDLDELQDLLAEVEDRLYFNRSHGSAAQFAQDKHDYEDIQGRIDEIEQEREL